MTERRKSKFPDWLRKRIPVTKYTAQTREILERLNLHTVCQSALCPNIGECFARHTATFMILGNICTRNCRFCAVEPGEVSGIDLDEPIRIGKAVLEMRLKHVVITSVTRDDLPDGGAGQFASTIAEIRKQVSDIIIEILTPDFQGSVKALETVAAARPDIFNHNIETVPLLYSKVRPEADYQRSLQVLRIINKFNPEIYTKSGIMVGLGEREADVINVMQDLRDAGCEILTIGQYLQPSRQHLDVIEYITPEKFAFYKEKGEALGFKYVAADPFVRSSFHADEFSLKHIKVK